MKKIRLLNEIASVKLGLAFKSAIIDEKDNGICYLIQTKDINTEGSLETSGLARVVPESNPDGHHLTVGDIVLRLRGPIFSAAIIEQEMDLPIITTNQNAVIKCDREMLHPNYLHWYINAAMGQKYFCGVGEGSNISKINAKFVSDMKLELPSLDTQKRVADIIKNWTSQRALYRQLIENGNNFFGGLCTKINLEEF